MPRQRQEEHVQREIIAYLAAAVPHAIVFAVPNAVHRTRHGRANAVAGMMRGAPDLVALLPAGKTLLIECKAACGRLSDAQLAFAGKCAVISHHCITARSHDDVRRALAALGVETREALK